MKTKEQILEKALEMAILEGAFLPFSDIRSIYGEPVPDCDKDMKKFIKFMKVYFLSKAKITGGKVK